MEIYITGNDELECITRDVSQLEPANPTFRKWRTENTIIKGWMINSMDPSLIMIGKISSDTPWLNMYEI